MKIRDRIKEFKRVPAKELIPNPKNWRCHPNKQREVLAGVLDDIGYADAVLVRELQDGKLQIIDGHLRAETTPNQDIPVLILDLNEEEADKLLAVFDPLASLAETNATLLNELVQAYQTDNEAIKEFLQEINS
ncbi:MAG: ParB N-terminal domain-containing protein, partial [Thermoguttaceae bacterium]